MSVVLLCIIDITGTDVFKIPLYNNNIIINSDKNFVLLSW